MPDCVQGGLDATPAAPANASVEGSAIGLDHDSHHRAWRRLLDQSREHLTNGRSERDTRDVITELRGTVLQRLTCSDTQRAQLGCECDGCSEDPEAFPLHALRDRED